MIAILRKRMEDFRPKKFPKRSQHWREKQRQARLGKKYPNITKALQGKKNLHHSEIMKGKKHRESTIIKMSESHRLEKHWHWQGGISSLQTMIRNLPESKAWKASIYKRDGYNCQDCTAHGVRLEAHHKNPFSKIFSEFLSFYSQFSPLEDKETLLRLALRYSDFWDTKNGETLCKKCHKNKKEMANGKTPV